VRSGDVVNFSTWDVLGIEADGQDENKMWVSRPDASRDDMWLWKPRMTTGKAEERLNDTSEVIVSAIAHALGIPAAECRYANRGSQDLPGNSIGCISRNVRPTGFALHPAAVLLKSDVPSYIEAHESPELRPNGRTRRRPDVGYTLEAAETVLQRLSAPAGSTSPSAHHVFAGFLILDALTGNTDRHPRNWGFISGPEGDSIAPAYDHGAALGSGLTDRRRADCSIEAWCRRGEARSMDFRPGLVDLAHEAVSRWEAGDLLAHTLTLDLPALVHSIHPSDGRLSEVATTFIRDVLIENQRRLQG
jgi:hypothetical protein